MRPTWIVGGLALVLLAVVAVGSWWAVNRFQWFARADSTSIAGFQLNPPLTDHKTKVWTIDFSRDGNLAASGDDGGQIIVWNTNANPWAPQYLPLGKTPVYSLAFSPDGTMLASGGQDKRDQAMEPVEKTLIESLTGRREVNFPRRLLSRQFCWPCHCERQRDQSCRGWRRNSTMA